MSVCVCVFVCTCACCLQSRSTFPAERFSFDFVVGAFGSDFAANVRVMRAAFYVLYTCVCRFAYLRSGYCVLGFSARARGFCVVFSIYLSLLLFYRQKSPKGFTCFLLFFVVSHHQLGMKTYEMCVSLSFDAYISPVLNGKQHTV